MNSSKDFSIIIAHRGDALGLWATVHSCQMELENSGYNYEYCICANGEAEKRIKDGTRNLILSQDLNNVLQFLSKSGHGGYTKILQRSISAPTARQMVARKAKGKYLFFLDNHCLVRKGYFDHAMWTFKRGLADLIHSTTRFYDGEKTAYEYKLTLEDNFWGVAKEEPVSAYNAYPVATGGHGGFAVKASVWKDIDGYWEGFTGYGGEELTTDLQLWMRGYKILLHPQMIHYHWPGRRPYARHFTPDYYRNMLMSANIIGGEEWLYKTYSNFSRNYPAPAHLSFYDILTEAYYRSSDYAELVRRASIRTFKEQLTFFSDNGISY